MGLLLKNDFPTMFDHPDLDKIPIHSICIKCGKVIRTTYSSNMFARHSYREECPECQEGK